MSALNSQSDRTLSLCWEQHCKLLPGVQGIHASQVVAWSVDEVRPLTCFPFSRVFCWFWSHLCSCCRSSGLSRIWLAVKSRPAFSKRRWELKHWLCSFMFNINRLYSALLSAAFCSSPVFFVGEEMMTLCHLSVNNFLTLPRKMTFLSVNCAIWIISSKFSQILHLSHSKHWRH